MTGLEDIIGNYTTFLNEILDQVAAEGLDFSDFSQIDHMCYRTTSLDNYQAKKSEFSSVADMLSETMVNERPIATFRLHKPVIHKQWRIDTVELPAPRPGKTHKEGLEHIEFVLFDDFPTFLEKYKGKPFETQAADRGINPEIGLRLGNYTVKFHLLALPVVVYLQNKLGISEVRDGQ